MWLNGHLTTGKVKQEPTLYREGPPYQRRGSLQLWQFLVTLLDDPANAHFIAWTGRGMEFKLIEPEEVWVGYEAVPCCAGGAEEVAKQARAAVVVTHNIPNTVHGNCGLEANFGRLPSSDAF